MGRKQWAVREVAVGFSSLWSILGHGLWKNHLTGKMIFYVNMQKKNDFKRL